MAAKFKTIKEVTKEVREYLRARKDGTIKSLRTGGPRLDGAMLDGIEWNSTITIGGRPAVGKSTYSDNLIEGCFENNTDFDLMDFNWEMSTRAILVRRLSASLLRSYKHIISADKDSSTGANIAITEVELDDINRILTEKYDNLPWIFCEEPQSVKGFADAVKKHVDATKRNTLVRIDHTLLTKQSSSESSQVQMLLNLLMAANEIKVAYPVIFMFLTQINREIEDRQENGTDKAFPRQGDVYGGDASAMFSETILLLNKPSKYGITYYGSRPKGRPVADNDIFAHMVKNRNGEGDFIIHYKENFKHMTIKEY